MKTLISSQANSTTAANTTTSGTNSGNSAAAANTANPSASTASSNTKSIVVPKTEATDATTATAALQQFQTPANQQAPTSLAAAGGNAKRPISLDLNNKSTPAKKPRLVTPLALQMDLADLQNGKSLSTPDVEKFILSSNLLQTPQPGCIFPTKAGPVTREQEDFGKGFEEVLHNLHNSKNSQAQQLNNSGPAAPTALATGAISGAGMSGGSFTYTNLENQPVTIKDEPQNGPASPPVSPIDMATQEKIKLERKRQRNRVAASKCRKRKLERISKLEDKVKILKGENADLSHVVKNLKDQVAVLKEEVITHANSGCTIPTMFNGSTLLQSK